MSAKVTPILEVYQSGPMTVVGFGGRDVLSDVNVATCRDELLELTKRENCREIAVDLTGVKLLPSGLLGLLASLRNNDVEVHLYNPSTDVQEVLSITGLDQIMDIHHVEIPRTSS